MTNQRRFCYYIPVDAFIEGYGYRISIVFENESGHYPTGDWPYDGTGRLPYFWGMTFEEAKQNCIEANSAMGISEVDAYAIVASSMGRQNNYAF